MYGGILSGGILSREVFVLDSSGPFRDVLTFRLGLVSDKIHNVLVSSRSRLKRSRAHPWRKLVLRDVEEDYDDIKTCAVHGRDVTPLGGVGVASSSSSSSRTLSTVEEVPTISQ